MIITTKSTWLGNEYGCRVFCDGKLVVEARCSSRRLIAPTFRQLLRTIDTLGGTRHTSEVRKRMYRPGEIVADKVQHLWCKG